MHSTIEMIAFGIFDNYSGGILLKLHFQDLSPALISVQSELAFELEERLTEAAKHFEKHGTPSEGDAPPLMPVAGEDFAAVLPGATVQSWTINVYANGLLWMVRTVDGGAMELLLPPSLVMRLREALRASFDQVCLIDLRPYNNMSWLEMSDVLEKHPGFRLRDRLTAFEFSVEVFRRNSRVLIEHLQSASGPLNDELIRWDRRFQIDEFLRDAIHHLFNFVAAAKALVDHSRVFYEQVYEPLELVADYKTEIKRRFHTNGLVAFIHGIRELMMHVGLVGLVHEKRFHSSNGLVGSVLMSKAQALMWGKWPKLARDWLHSGPDRIRILDTVQAYERTIEEFHEWFMAARERAHWKEFREAELLRRAVLARRGMQEIPKLARLLELPPGALTPMRDAIGQFLTAEQSFKIREFETDAEGWLTRAFDYLQERYYVPETLRHDVLSHFTSRAS